MKGCTVRAEHTYIIVFRLSGPWTQIPIRRRFFVSCITFLSLIPCVAILAFVAC